MFLIRSSSIKGLLTNNFQIFNQLIAIIQLKEYWKCEILDVCLIWTMKFGSEEFVPLRCEILFVC